MTVAEQDIIIVPASDLPTAMRNKIRTPWCWFVLQEGWIRAAGGEVCSSICWELADAAARRLDRERRTID